MASSGSLTGSADRLVPHSNGAQSRTTRPVRGMVASLRKRDGPACLVRGAAGGWVVRGGRRGGGRGRESLRGPVRGGRGWLGSPFLPGRHPWRGQRTTDARYGRVRGEKMQGEVGVDGRGTGVRAPEGR